MKKTTINPKEYGRIFMHLSSDTQIGDYASRYLIYEIMSMQEGEVALLVINNGGGSVGTALDIRNAIKLCKGRVDAFISGYYASSCVIVGTACKNRFVSESAIGMLHDPKSVMYGAYSKQELASQSKSLELVKESLISSMIVDTSTSVSRDKLSEMMTNETWLSPQEMISIGFFTELAEIASSYYIEEDATGEPSQGDTTVGNVDSFQNTQHAYDLFLSENKIDMNAFETIMTAINGLAAKMSGKAIDELEKPVIEEDIQDVKNTGEPSEPFLETPVSNQEQITNEQFGKLLEAINSIPVTKQATPKVDTTIPRSLKTNPVSNSKDQAFLNILSRRPENNTL